MSKARPLTPEKDLRAILYYCVREQFNADRDPKFIDKTYDSAIRAAIDYFQTRFSKGRPPSMIVVEFLALDNCAKRRGIDLLPPKPKLKKRNKQMELFK